MLAATGVAFALAGVAVTAQSLGVTADDPRYALLGALLVTVLAAPFNWIAFGPGERRFSGGLSFLARPPPQATRRAPFGGSRSAGGR